MDCEKQERIKQNKEKLNVIYRVVKEKFPIITNELIRRWEIETSTWEHINPETKCLADEVVKEFKRYEMNVDYILENKRYENVEYEIKGIFPIWADINTSFANILEFLLTILNIKFVRYIHPNVLYHERMVLFLLNGDISEDMIQGNARI